MVLGLLGRNVRPFFVGGLVLVISDDSELNAAAVFQRHCVHQRIIEIDVFAGINVRALLLQVPLVHLKHRKICPPVLAQIERLSGCNDMGPITITDVVARASLISSSRRKKTVYRPNGKTLFIPTENYRLIVLIAQAARSANRTSGVVR